jgi:hypothetical protein
MASMPCLAHPRPATLTLVMATALASLLPDPAGAWPLVRRPVENPTSVSNSQFPELVVAFQSRGFRVEREHERCTERGLYGIYLRRARMIVVCPVGNQSDTLLHEGWHAVQARCLRGAPLLDQATLDRGLTAADRRDISQLYTGAAWQREAEARVMARSTPDSYFAWVDKLCTGKLPAPVTATTPVPAPASR